MDINSGKNNWVFKFTTWYYYLTGVIFIWIGLAFLQQSFNSNLFLPYPRTDFELMTGLFYRFTGILFIGCSLLLFLIGKGLSNWQSWIRWALVAIFSFSIAGALIGFWFTKDSTSFIEILFLIFLIVVTIRKRFSNQQSLTQLLTNSGMSLSTKILLSISSILIIIGGIGVFYYGSRSLEEMRKSPNPYEQIQNFLKPQNL